MTTKECCNKENRNPLQSKSKEPLEQKIPYPRKNVWSESDFKILGDLCSGKFGVVKKALYIPTNTTVALKIISKDKIQRFNCIDQIKNEIEIHTRLKHPYIIDCYGYYRTENYVAIIMEYASDGCLFTKKIEANHLSEKESSQYIKQLLLSLRYLHELKIIHRDIKPENILLKNKSIKLCDFGWAARTSHTPMRKSLCGTLEYMSYELCTSKSYDEKIDIWSVGILAYELITGDVPYKSDTVEGMSQSVLLSNNSHLKSNLLSEDAYSFICSILVAPEKRASIVQLLRHPFITKYTNSSYVR